METFPWEPPDGASRGFGSRSVGVGVDVDVGVASRCEFGASCRQIGGHGWEMPGRERDAHGAALPGSGVEVEVGASREVQLDLGLTDITRYSSYSKLWRTLYFVNDAPFRIHNHVFNGAGPLCILNGNWYSVQRCNAELQGASTQEMDSLNPLTNIFLVNPI